MKQINQKLADQIMERIELEEKMLGAFLMGKNGVDIEEFKKQLNEWLQKKFPDLEIK